MSQRRTFPFLLTYSVLAVIFALFQTSSLQAGEGGGEGDLPEPFGPEQQINSYTTGLQQSPAIARNGIGFVVTWSGEGYDSTAVSPETDVGIWLRLLNSGFAVAGSESQVNTYTTGVQQSPDVTENADGGFTVVWDSIGDRLVSRQFDSEGDPDGAEVTVAAGSMESRRPRITPRADGGALVVWPTHTTTSDIRARVMSSTGTFPLIDFRVNSVTTTVSLYPTAATMADGRFIVVWHEGATDASVDRSLKARFVSSTGTPLGSDLALSAYPTGELDPPAVAAHPDGEFVVAWRSYNEIYARLFDASGNAVGGEMQISEATGSNGVQSNPDVVVDERDRFVFAWRNDSVLPFLGTPIYISSQAGIKPPSFQLKETSAGRDGPVLTLLPIQRLNVTALNNTAYDHAPRLSPDFLYHVGVWDGEGTSDGVGVAGISTAAGLFFRDGFESGDTSAWTSTNP